jgi:hypothetical protein
VPLVSVMVYVCGYDGSIVRKYRHLQLVYGMRLKATKMEVEVRRSPTIGDGGVRKQVSKYVRFTYKWESNLGRAGRRSSDSKLASSK